YFRLVAANGQPVGRSEGYNAKPACKAGIKSVQKNAASEIE
ncbi:MAG: YegP family protein, partial [Erysipelotrichaceae bacterium]|nr:YegP family protein [Erysipelotrichaceae bacterium]